jgi:hypothetical protein
VAEAREGALVREAREGALAPGGRWGPLLWGLLGALCCASVSGFEPNLLEEGIELHVAQRLASGEQLYRDVLVFTGPFPFELLGLLFRIFGDEVWVARGVVVAMHGLASAAAFALARGSDRGALAHAAAAATACAPLVLFPLFSIYYYTTIAFHLSLLAGWAAWRGVGSEVSLRWGLLAGALVAAIALSKQTLGVSMAIAVLVALFASSESQRRGALLGFVLGGAGAAALSVGAWIGQGTLDAAIHGLVTLPASLDASYQLPFLNLWPIGQLSVAAAESQTFYLPYFYILTESIFVEATPLAIGVTQLLFALPLLALFVSVVRLRRSGAPPALWLHTAISIAWLVNLTPRTDWGHLVHVLPLATAQLCLAIPGPSARAGWARAVSRSFTAAICAALAVGSVFAWRIIDQNSDTAVLNARVPLRPVSSPLRGMHLRSVIDYLERHTRRGEAIFVPRAEPLIYFATDTRNPTPYPGVFPAERDAQQRTILAALDEVRFVVMSDVDQPAMTYYRDELPAIQAYLERFFRPAPPFAGDQHHWITVLERGPPRAATRIDLARSADAGRTFTRSATGIEDAAPFDGGRLAVRRNRRLLAFPLGSHGGGIDFEFEVPNQAVFEADASLGRAFAEDDVYGIPENSTVVVSIGEPGAMTKLHEQSLGTGWSPRWIPFSADLGPWSGQRVTLRLELVRPPAGRPSAVSQIGYLGSPRIVARRSP